MRIASLALIAALTAPPLAAAAPPDDPYIWLEEATSPRAMTWVEQHNASAKKLEADPRYQGFYDEALKLAAAKDRIPAPVFLHGAIYNFWQDGDHLRGYWRKTSLADYGAAEPAWTTVLDIDALGKAEGKSWVFKGMDCLHPDERLCLVSLSDGGEDAIEVREFDLDSQTFVDGGFRLPKAKTNATWEDKDHILVSSEWTPGDLTPSGYPYIVKRLTRGQPLSAAVEVYRGEKSDGGYGVAPGVLMDGEGRTLAVIVRPLDTFRHETWILTGKGAERLAIPAKADVQDLVAGRILVQLNEAWSADGQDFTAGSLIELDLDATKADPAHPHPKLIWAPGPRESLEGVAATRDRLLITTLDNVRGRAFEYTPVAGGGWTHVRLNLPDNLTLGIADTDRRSNLAFLSASGFLDPNGLYLLGEGSLKLVKSLPAKFDASQDVVEQLEAASTDGTKIPYFVVHRRDIKYDGSTPTLMTAYGGFQVSNTPYYSAVTGKLWLERGGAFVLANIRGGGEFGPAWHEAGLGVKRQIIYDDFAAVAEDLIARKITSPRRLGIEGGSNGGLLMGVEFTQHPELWRAVVIQVPLLDMIRISKIAAGASWEGEYGDVNTDPASWPSGSRPRPTRT